MNRKNVRKKPKLASEFSARRIESRQEEAGGLYIQFDMCEGNNFILNIVNGTLPLQVTLK